MTTPAFIANDHIRRGAAPRSRIEIALVNNMPDAAVRATERQFAGLIDEAAPPDIDVNFKLFALASLPRDDVARAAMRDRYSDVDVLIQAGTDALIVTGAEPRAADLHNEPYWSDLTGLIDWARTNTVSTVWSCLAAHAAVLHMDGIERQPLKTKCAGIFAFRRSADARLTRGLPDMIRLPHSRRNGLPAVALEAHGYQILNHSPQVGVDTFIRPGQSLFVFLQGHPEYDGDSLLREYCRDVGRYLRGLTRDYPQTPHGYFDARTERSFRNLAVEARAGREAELLGRYSEIAAAFQPTRPWRPQSVTLFRNWLELVAAGKAAADASTHPSLTSVYSPRAAEGLN